MAPRRIYLDNAATSFPKPPGVYEAMLRYGTEVGASPGRGQYAESREGARLIRQCRERICRLINGESADHVVFALNTTDALNLAIKGVVRQRRLDRAGARIRIITTAMDHNSVLRPLTALEADGVDLVCVGCDPATGLVDPRDIVQAMDADTALVAVVMASNVAGTIQPAAEIGRVCAQARVPFLVDAAQSLGHIPVDVRAIGADLLAFPGHKGLLGPQGTGGLYIRPGVEALVATTREGGTGSWSESDAHPQTMPEKFEAGSHNTIGIIGLSEGVKWLLDRGLDAVRLHELGLIRFMLTELRRAGARLSDGSGGDGPLAGLRLLGPVVPEHRVGVFAFTHETLTPHEAAAVLEQLFGLLVRAGLTCAPHAHKAFGTHPDQGGAGAFRMSFGPFVEERDAGAAIDALVELCEGARATTEREPARA